MRGVVRGRPKRRGAGEAEIRYRARGGATELLEGTWQPKRLVIVEFPSTKEARAWWSSREYAEAKALRQACARTEMVLLEGLAAPAAR